MEHRDLPLPGARGVTATLDLPDGAADDEPAAVVVACPPHPQMGGTRSDRRLVAVSEAVVDASVACLRFDYGPWDGGYGEREDACSALRWAGERYDRLGLFGFSFGGAVAALAAAGTEQDLRAVSLLAPASRLAADLDAAAALADVDAPVQVVYGSRDSTADWEPLVERARALDCNIVELSADHFFVGQDAKVAEAVAGFLCPALG